MEKLINDLKEKNMITGDNVFEFVNGHLSYGAKGGIIGAIIFTSVELASVRYCSFCGEYLYFFKKKKGFKYKGIKEESIEKIKISEIEKFIYKPRKQYVWFTLEYNQKKYSKEVYNRSSWNWNKEKFNNLVNYLRQKTTVNVIEE